ncbi:MAG: class I SAM-dependent methyltransferase [Pseudomonadota bacterium]
MARRIRLAKPGAEIPFTGERATPFVTEPLLAEHLHRYFTALDLCAGRKVLDIACGEGYGAALMALNGAAAVTGIDIDAATIERARRVYSLPRLRFETGDAQQPLALATGSVDLVTCFETIEHVVAQEALLAELARILAPDGVLLISTPDRERAGAETSPNPFHERELSLAEFRALLAPHFPHLTLRHQRQLTGSVLSDPEAGFTAEQVFWEREGFLEFSAAARPSAPRFFLIAASRVAPVALPTGLLHDGRILASLRKALRAARG